jgi:antitoxin component YwqK of YwqJK toxin-antitoxin module
MTFKMLGIDKKYRKQFNIFKVQYLLLDKEISAFVFDDIYSISISNNSLTLRKYLGNNKVIYKYFKNNKLRKQYYSTTNGHQNGEYKEFYPTGQLSCITFKKDDKLDGFYDSWHRNGKTAIKCFFKEGNYMGEYKSCDKKGKIIYRTFYNNGDACSIKYAKQKYPEGPWLEDN